MTCIIRSLTIFPIRPRRVDWEKYYAQATLSPYQPKVKGPGDASNFEVYPEEPVRWYGEGPDVFGDTFVGF